MSTANSEYLQVWGQVKQWPIELREDLAKDIAKSVESDLPVANGPWTDAKNARRCELIDKDIQSTLSANERRELDLLTREMREHRDRIAPLPIEGARRLHQELLEKKRLHDASANGNS